MNASAPRILLALLPLLVLAASAEDIPGEGHMVSPSFFECRELVGFVIAHGTS